MSKTMGEVEDFVTSLEKEHLEKAKENANTFFNEEYFERLGGPEEVIKTEFPAFAWKEFYFGLCPPVRQFDLIYRRGEPYYDDRDLIVGLGKQMRDEVKHARIFSNIAEQFGIDADMVSWDAPNHPDGYYESLVEAGYAGADHEEPHFVAAGFQCSTEIGATFQIQNMAAYLQDEYPNVAAALRDIASDEGDHVDLGVMIANRFAEPDSFEEMEEIANKKYESIREGLRLAFERAGETAN